ncbi:papain-like cysteine protease family protein [Paenimyroides ummariense]|nr:papain-like cysteine protease family protein [Paenimyroides ummariense]
MLVLLLYSTSQLKAQINCQEKSMWCWAACVQSALGQAGVQQTQSQIVSRLTGWPEDRPARSEEVIALLTSYNFRAWNVAYPANPEQLYNTLASGWKLIAFVNPSNNPNIGHFIMLQGISPYTGNIMVSDPSSCLTYEQDIQHLYYAWKWSSSIVVGTPLT